MNATGARLITTAGSRIGTSSFLTPGVATSSSCRTRPFHARESLALWRQQLDRFDNLADVRKPCLGLAYAAQESLPLPEGADWVFIAGSTEWKPSEAAVDVSRRAWDAGRYIHVGRLNSQKRYRHFRNLAQQLDLDIVSCDGTVAHFDPARALHRLTDPLYESGMIRG